MNPLLRASDREYYRAITLPKVYKVPYLIFFHRSLHFLMQ